MAVLIGRHSWWCGGSIYSNRWLQQILHNLLKFGYMACQELALAPHSLHIRDGHLGQHPKLLQPERQVAFIRCTLHCRC